MVKRMTIPVRVSQALFEKCEARPEFRALTRTEIADAALRVLLGSADGSLYVVPKWFAVAATRAYAESCVQACLETLGEDPFFKIDHAQGRIRVAREVSAGASNIHKIYSTKLTAVAGGVGDDVRSLAQVSTTEN